MQSPISSWTALSCLPKVLPKKEARRRESLSRVSLSRSSMMTPPACISQPREPTRKNQLPMTTIGNNNSLHPLLLRRIRRPPMNLLRSMNARSIRPRVCLKRKRKESPKRILYTSLRMIKRMLLQEDLPTLTSFLMLHITYNSKTCLIT